MHDTIEYHQAARTAGSYPAFELANGEFESLRAAKVLAKSEANNRYQMVVAILIKETIGDDVVVVAKFEKANGEWVEIDE